MSQHDFVAIQETHSTSGTLGSVSVPDASVTKWSHGTRHQGGVAITLLTSFLQTFDEIQDEDWEEAIPGRLAVLHLRRSRGRLALVTAYLPSGRCEADRKQVRLRLRAMMQRRPDVLRIVMGDCNYVTKSEDRFYMISGSPLGVGMLLRSRIGKIMWLIPAIFRNFPSLTSPIRPACRDPAWIASTPTITLPTTYLPTASRSRCLGYLAYPLIAPSPSAGKCTISQAGRPA